MAALRRGISSLGKIWLRGNRISNGNRTMSTSRDDKSMCPRLILPPPETHRYYSLGEKRVLSIPQPAETPSSSAEFVGSSHGWIALFNQQSNELFLSNPISRRRIDLPSVEHLSEDGINFRRGRGSVSKVVLSSSPDAAAGDWCAIITYGPGNTLAFSSSDRRRWRSAGDESLFLEETLYVPDHLQAKVHEDIVYYDKRRILASITPIEFDLATFRFELRRRSRCEVGVWADISTCNPIPIPEVSELRDWHRINEECGEKTRRWAAENIGVLEEQCIQIPHLVYSEDHPTELPYLVMRLVALVGVDSVQWCPVRGLRGDRPYRCRTVGFVVFRIRHREPEVIDDLNGLAMFVGVNNSFAVSASRFPELEPNSIYFTDAKRLRMLHGADDVGIFNYEKKTLTPINIDSPLRSSPVWFSPPSTA